MLNEDYDNTITLDMLGGVYKYRKKESNNNQIENEDQQEREREERATPDNSVSQLEGGTDD